MVQKNYKYSFVEIWKYCNGFIKLNKYFTI